MEYTVDPKPNPRVVLSIKDKNKIINHLEKINSYRIDIINRMKLIDDLTEDIGFILNLNER